MNNTNIIKKAVNVLVLYAREQISNEEFYNVAELGNSTVKESIISNEKKAYEDVLDELTPFLIANCKDETDIFILLTNIKDGKIRPEQSLSLYFAKMAEIILDSYLFESLWDMHMGIHYFSQNPVSKQ